MRSKDMLPNVRMTITATEDIIVAKKPLDMVNKNARIYLYIADTAAMKHLCMAVTDARKHLSMADKDVRKQYRMVLVAGKVPPMVNMEVKKSHPMGAIYTKTLDFRRPMASKRLQDMDFSLVVAVTDILGNNLS